MRWFMIGFLVSLAALLFAAGGAARHIWLQRRKQRSETLAAAGAVPGPEPEREP